MMVQVTIMRPDTDAEVREIDLPADPGFYKLDALLLPLLNGCDLEHVAVLHNGERADMFVDETGSLKGLPRNEAATAVYRNNWLTQHPKKSPEALPAIYGPAILFSKRVWF
jgi:hypothetical protein